MSDVSWNIPAVEDAFDSVDLLQGPTADWRVNVQRRNQSQM
jgi:hypothetical protein